MSAPLPPPVIVGVTGASGTVYARRLVEVLLGLEQPVSLVVSGAGRRVLRSETDAAALEAPWGTKNLELLRESPEKDVGAAFCSGSYPTRGVVIVPASMGTIGAVAAGYSANAIHRAAEVALKERRRLVVVPRETPFSTIHLRNLLELSQAGAVILPPSPGFYHRPRSIEDIVDFVVARIVDALGIDHAIAPRWGMEDPRDDED